MNKPRRRGSGMLVARPSRISQSAIITWLASLGLAHAGNLTFPTWRAGPRNRRMILDQRRDHRRPNRITGRIHVEHVLYKKFGTRLVVRVEHRRVDVGEGEPPLVPGAFGCDERVGFDDLVL